MPANNGDTYPHLGMPRVGPRSSVRSANAGPSAVASGLEPIIRSFNTARALGNGNFTFTGVFKAKVATSGFVRLVVVFGFSSHERRCLDCAEAFGSWGLRTFCLHCSRGFGDIANNFVGAMLNSMGNTITTVLARQSFTMYLSDAEYGDELLEY